MKNVLLLGRKYWSVLALKHLIAEGYNIVGVVGNPNEINSENPQKSLLSYAKSIEVPIYKHDELYNLINSENKTFNGIHVDIVISYLFWGKVKKNLLDIALVGSVNFHPAPLPEYQGLGGYNAAILDEFDNYGVTAHIMNENIDAGDILKVNRFSMVDNETAYSLEQKSMVELLELFKEIFSNNLNDYISNSYKNEVHKGRYINRAEFEEMKYILSSDNDEEINRKIRAFWYPPYEGAKVKIGDSYYTIVNESLLHEISKKYYD